MFKSINRFLEALERMADGLHRIADAQEKRKRRGLIKKATKKATKKAKRKSQPADTVEGTLKHAGLTKVLIPVRDQHGKLRPLNQELPPDKEAIFQRMLELPRPVQVELVKIAMRSSPMRSANPDDEAVEEFDDERLRRAARPLILAGRINVPAPEIDEEGL